MEHDADRDADDRPDREARGRLPRREEGLVEEHAGERRLLGRGRLPEPADDVLQAGHRVLVDLERPRPAGREVELAVPHVERAQPDEHRDEDPEALEDA